MGPWVVADTIPAEIYRIPPSGPLFHDRYVDFGYWGGGWGTCIASTANTGIRIGTPATPSGFAITPRGSAPQTPGFNYFSETDFSASSPIIGSA